MKTTYNPLGNVNVLTLDDIIFAERNQAYGAYYLRKSYNKIKIESFLFTSAMVATIFVWSLFSRAKGDSLVDEGLKNTGPFEMTEMPPSPTDPLPQLAPPATDQSVIDIIKYKVPVVVDIDPGGESQLPPFEEAGNEPGPDINTNIGPFSLTGSGEGKGGGGPIIDEPEKPFYKVELSATFQGGDIDNFRKWIAQNIKYPVNVIDMRIQGKVIVKFVVNKEGRVDNVELLRSVDTYLDNEVIRVIRSSPKWTPGKQGGNPVRQLFIIPIDFKLQEK